MEARGSLVDDFQRLPGTAHWHGNLKKHRQRHKGLKEVLGVEARHLSAVTTFLCRHNLMHTIVAREQGSKRRRSSLKQPLIYAPGSYERAGNANRGLSGALPAAFGLIYATAVCFWAMGEVKSLLSPGGSIVE